MALTQVIDDKNPPYPAFKCMEISVFLESALSISRGFCSIFRREKTIKIELIAKKTKKKVGNTPTLTF